MPTISVSQQTFAALQALAEPFVDTPDTVIARLIAEQAGASRRRPPPNGNGLNPSKGPSSMPRVRPGGRAPKGQVTPRRVYKDLVVRTLRDAGGELPTQQVIDRVGDLMKSRFLPLDLGTLQSGEERWINAVRFARQELVNEGKLDPTRHGVWKLK